MADRIKGITVEIGGGEAGEEAIVGTERLSSLVTNAVLAAGGGGAQTIVIPVYIGQERIDELVVKATQRTNFRSGGRQKLFERCWS